jgi:hypothetical protein
MSTTLAENLGTEPHRAPVIADCVALIDAQVKQKGFVVKSAYGVIKAIKKRFVPEVVDALLDDWLAKLQPHYDRWAAAKQATFSDFMVARSDDVAEDLLSVTDARADKTSHTTAKKMYLRMRDSAKRDVVEAIPDLAKMIEKYLNGAARLGERTRARLDRPPRRAERVSFRDAFRRHSGTVAQCGRPPRSRRCCSCCACSPAAASASRSTIRRTRRR